MRFSRRRHLVTVQRPVRTQDPTTGELVDDWAPVGDFWASIAPLKGRELMTNEQILDKMDTRLTFRWSPMVDTFTAAYRGVHQGTVFNFTSIAHVNLAQREVEIMATSGVNNG
jgi:head-tail adaptor